MKNNEKRRELLQIAFLLWLDTLGFAIYYFASRAYISDTLGEAEAYRYVTLLVGVEGIGALVAPIGGFIGDVHGYRIIGLLSSLRFIAYYSIILVEPRLIFIPAFVASLLTNLFYSNALGALLQRVEGSAKTYAVYTLALPLAWSVGSLMPGLLHKIGGYSLVFLAVSLVSLLASMILAFIDSTKNDRIGYNDLMKALTSLPIHLVAGLLLAGAGLTLYWNLLSIKLYAITQSLLVYGLIGGTLATMTSMIARPIAGIIAERLNPARMLSLVFFAYLLYGVIMYFATGLVFSILWILPIYPFREIAQTMTVSRSLPKYLQNTAGGVVTLTYNLPAITYPLFYVMSFGMAGGLLFYIISLSLATILVLIASFSWLLATSRD